jgi:hypothetical protein
MKNISLNFGAIKDTVYRLSAKEIVYESDEKKRKNNSLTKFVDKIKKEPLLKIQYMIFENLTKGHFDNERLAERYINENMSLLKNVDWHKLLECNKITRKEILDEHFVQGSVEFEDLYESIHDLIESRTRIGYSDINKSHESYENVLAHLQRDVVKNLKENEEGSDMPSFLSWRYINEHAVSNFNKRYKHLNESDKNLLKVLVSSDDVKINFAKDLKNESLEIINNLLEDESESKGLLENFKFRLESIDEVNKLNVDEIIINCSELNENLLKLQ